MDCIFESESAVCCICQTPLGGDNIRKRGDKYYCVEDYEKTSYEEKNNNQKQLEEERQIKKLFN